MRSPLAKLFPRLGRLADTDPSALPRLESNVARAFESLGTEHRDLLGVEVELDMTAGSATTTNHKLGDTPNRFRVRWLDADLRLYKSGTWTDKELTLTAAGTGTSTVQIWVWRA